MGVRVEPVMGTVVSIDVRDPDPADPAIARAIEEAVAWLHEVDARFSPFRETSEIRRLDRGELALDDCHPDVRHVLRACEDLREATGGAFDVRGHDPSGRLDPSGFVKGWAVDEAADRLTAAGARSFAVNAGGDIVVRGEAAPGQAWRVGIRDPAAGIGSPRSSTSPTERSPRPGSTSAAATSATRAPGASPTPTPASPSSGRPSASRTPGPPPPSRSGATVRRASPPCRGWASWRSTAPASPRGRTSSRAFCDDDRARRQVQGGFRIRA